ncbi:MAG: virulence RhuM family protein [Bacilli bacterium]|nr:virulence RhuM family protein [Bacilli bacterium]
MDGNYELVKFEQNGLTLDVNVSPLEETVWLTKDDMALLFGRDRTVISRHVSHIIKEEELDANRVCAKNARTGPDGKNYIVDFYNLDVVISVGYRVKSKNGIVFRQWQTMS